MPRVPGDPFADVAPSTGPTGQFDQRPQVSPQTSSDMFGGQVARGMDQMGDMLAQHVQAMQGLQNEATARDASVQLDQKVGQLWEGYNSLSGKAATDAFPQFQQSLEKARQDAVAAMPNPNAQRMLAGEAASVVARYTTYGGSYAASENKKWQMQSHQAFGANAVTQAVQERNNPDAIGGYLAKAGDSAEQYAMMDGAPPEMATARGLAAKGQLLQTVVATLAAEDPGRAVATFQRYQGQIDGQSTEAITRMLEPKIIHGAAQAAANAVFPMPGLDSGTAGTGVTSAAPMTADATARAQRVHDLFVNKGWSDQAGWGLAANGHWESGNTPGAVGDGGASTGAFQWNGPRRAAYIAQNGHGPEAGDLAENVNFADWELRNTEKAAGNAIAAAPDAKTAAQVASTLFLRPAAVSMEAARRGNTAALLAGNAADTTDGAPAAPPAMGAYPDKSAMILQAMKLAGPDPRVQEAAASEVERRVNLYAVQHAQDSQKLKSDLSNLIPALWQGNDLPIPEDRIRALLPPEQAAEKLTDARFASVGGQIVKGLQFATPAEQAQTMSDFTGGMGTASATLRLKLAKAGVIDSTSADPNTAETPALYNVRMKLANMISEQLQKNTTSLNNDPANYAMANPQVSQLAAQIDPQKPDSFAAYADATTGLQTHLGVADQDTWLLPQNRAKAIVTQLMSADPKTMDAGAQIDALAKSYGDAPDAAGNPNPNSRWPQVWHDLVRSGLPPEWNILGSMPAGPDRMGFQRALQAVQAKGGLNALGETISKTDKQAIDQNLAQTLQPFMRSVMIPGLQGDPALVSSMASALRTYAYSNVMNGQSGQAALNHAGDALLHYDYEGPDGLARAPAGTGAQASRYGDRLLGALTPAQIAPAEGGTGMRPADQAAATIAGLRRTGTWITNQRGDGWELWSRNTDGSWSGVTRPDGSRFGFQFADIPADMAAASMQQDPKDLSMTP